MKIIYKIMRNHSRQGVPCVVFEVDNEKYYFNVPETTQRFIRDHGSKFSKDSKFFFSRLTATHLAGVIGLSLTLFQHSLSQGSKIYGPPGVCQFFRDLRYVTGIKMCHYSVACLKNESESEIIGICDDDEMLKLVNSPDAIDIFTNWDEYCRKNPLPPKSLNQASSLFKPSMYLTEGLQKASGYSVYSDKVTEIIYVPISEVSNAYVIIPKPMKANFMPQKLKDYGIKGKDMSTLLKQGFIEVTKTNQGRERWQKNKCHSSGSK
jgi:ribonuclease BN (tRNA processing enzyme)